MSTPKGETKDFIVVQKGNTYFIRLSGGGQVPYALDGQFTSQAIALSFIDTYKAGNDTPAQSLIKSARAKQEKEQHAAEAAFVREAMKEEMEMAMIADYLETKKAAKKAPTKKA